MFIGNGDDFAKMLMNKKTTCPKCKSTIVFEESAKLANQIGVKENAVMCKNCRAIYTATLTPNLVLIDDITNKYN